MTTATTSGGWNKLRFASHCSGLGMLSRSLELVSLDHLTQLLARENCT